MAAMRKCGAANLLAVTEFRPHIPELTCPFSQDILMLYDAYEVQRSLLTSASKLAGLGAGWLNNPTNPFGYSSMGPLVAAGLEVFAHASAPRGKPEFGIEQVLVGKRAVVVDEDIVLRNAFGQLKHFRKVDAD